MLWMEQDPRREEDKDAPWVPPMHCFIFSASGNEEKVFWRPIDLVPLFDILAFKFLFLFFLLTGHIEVDRSLNSLWPPRPTDGKCQYNRCCRPITVYIAGYYHCRIPPGGRIPESHLQDKVIKHKRPLQKYTCAETRSPFLLWLMTNHLSRCSSTNTKFKESVFTLCWFSLRLKIQIEFIVKHIFNGSNVQFYWHVFFLLPFWRSWLEFLHLNETLWLRHSLACVQFTGLYFETQ